MFNKILNSCEYVTNNSKDVKINYDKIDELVKGMDNTNCSHWLQNSPYGILDFDIEDIINFLLLYHSIGFSYWGNPKWTIKTEFEDLDGAYAMMYLLISEIKCNPKFLNPAYLQYIKKNQLKELLKGNIDIPLFNERYLNIVSMSKTINNKMNGDFYNYIKDITNDSELFQIIIDNFSYFSDTATYGSESIYFYKLAQLLTSDILHVRKIKEKINVDYSHLLGCADYKIPQVMRNLGILQYSSDLANLIDNKKEIIKGSNYEIEIRASVLVAINIINNKNNNKFCSITINDYIWLKGQDSSCTSLPYHLTRTILY